MSNSSFYQSLSAEESKRFKYWQRRTIIASMIGYALFYFVRKNLSIAMPGMQEDLGVARRRGESDEAIPVALGRHLHAQGRRDIQPLHGKDGINTQTLLC